MPCARKRPPKAVDHVAALPRRSRDSRNISLVGVDGVRALYALGIEPGIVQLNERSSRLAALRRSPADRLGVTEQEVRRRRASE